jgi:hypothetical protein
MNLEKTKRGLNQQNKIRICFVIFILSLSMGVLLGKTADESMKNVVLILGVITASTSIVFAMFLIYASIEVVYKALRYNSQELGIVSVKTIELSPREIDEEWQGFFGEQKYEWKKSGLTKNQIYGKEIMFSLDLSWGKTKHWVNSLKFLSWLKSI